MIDLVLKHHRCGREGDWAEAAAAGEDIFGWWERCMNPALMAELVAVALSLDAAVAPVYEAASCEPILEQRLREFVGRQPVNRSAEKNVAWAAACIFLNDSGVPPADLADLYRERFPVAEVLTTLLEVRS